MTCRLEYLRSSWERGNLQRGTMSATVFLVHGLAWVKRTTSALNWFPPSSTNSIVTPAVTKQRQINYYLSNALNTDKPSKEISHGSA